ncbi:SH3 domain-containing protein [Collimonas sp.]|jgi:SH3-like domain-containing protein|uniref:SH3 domain-containing protein n=1 Tax=Collimonas sp. TaxID=1963772 RepID=UPI0037BF5F3F
MKFARIATSLLLSLGSLLALANSAHALDFKAVGAAPVILCDAPSEKGRRVAVAPRGMPVEVVLTYGEWTKVRDASGDLSWLQSKGLVAKRNLQVNVANAKIRANPDDTAPVVFTADKGVLLELVDPVASGWAKVRHRDGQSGYVKASEVWGA